MFIILCHLGNIILFTINICGFLSGPSIYLAVSLVQPCCSNTRVQNTHGVDQCPANTDKLKLPSRDRNLSASVLYFQYICCTGKHLGFLNALQPPSCYRMIVLELLLLKV